MTVCELWDSADVELYFYGELGPGDRARVAGHLQGCAPCRQRLEELQAIRQALGSRPAVAAPPEGDWSGFMHRLDQRIAGTAATTRVPARNISTRQALALAATIALATAGVIGAARFRSAVGQGVALSSPRVEAPFPSDSAHPQHALREGSTDLLERSKLVVLGLATRDPGIPSADWQYERTLASTLLFDTRLYRQAAVNEGASDVERVMRDLETVLLEASMSETSDQAALGRVQRLIAKRDLVVRMQVLGAAGPAGD